MAKVGGISVATTKRRDDEIEELLGTLPAACEAPAIVRESCEYVTALVGEVLGSCNTSAKDEEGTRGVAGAAAKQVQE